MEDLVIIFCPNFSTEGPTTTDPAVGVTVAVVVGLDATEAVIAAVVIVAAVEAGTAGGAAAGTVGTAAGMGTAVGSRTAGRTGPRAEAGPGPKPRALPR